MDAFLLMDKQDLVRLIPCKVLDQKTMTKIKQQEGIINCLLIDIIYFRLQPHVFDYLFYKVNK